ASCIELKGACSHEEEEGKKTKESKQEDQYKKRNANETHDHQNQEKIVHMNKEAVTQHSNFIRELHNAAVVIQSAFRGYLARRALLALQGIVKLQAFIRGHTVRKQAKLTLTCIQALVRLQSQMSEQQARLSHERCRKSMFAESSNLWDRYKQDVRQRKSTSARRCSAADEWDFFPCQIEDDIPVLESRNYTSFKREKALAYAISQQLWRYDSNIVNRTEWLTRWMATKKRDSADREDSTRTVQLNKVVESFMANTPPSVSRYSCSNESGSTTPHYMNSTESAKAKARLVSTPNKRPSTQGRERVRKRLSYPVTEQHGGDHTDNNGSFSQCLTSPSFKTVSHALDRGDYVNSTTSMRRLARLN
ncbi:hypothetical protein V2J09_022522, partial [Rumex salicifolius]